MTPLWRWWEQIWSRRLGLVNDPFPRVFADLQERLMVIQKRCDALMPTVWEGRR